MTSVKIWSLATTMMMNSDLGGTDTRTSRDALEFPHRRSRWRSRIREGAPGGPSASSAARRLQPPPVLGSGAVVFHCFGLVFPYC